MSKGILVLAQGTDYVIQACVLAMSLKITNKSIPISVVTNDSIPEKYQNLFDKIISIPFSNDDIETDLKVENRWKLYHCTPYDETIVMDTDMIVLQDISHWWNILSDYELFFVTNPKTYRNEQLVGDFYRQAFTANNLPDLYVGIHYFKKCEFAKEFYKWIELITYNWELFYGKFVKEKYPKFPSMDITASLTAKILNCEEIVLDKHRDEITFVHMKPYVQGWKNPTQSWQNTVDAFLDSNCNLKIGNYFQTQVFHYTENSFINDSIIEVYERKINEQY